MEIKKLAISTLNFTINRFIEFLGIVIIIISLLLLISLLSYSPDDPNFIFPENSVIQNILGFHGSFISDLFFQSFGVIALLIPFSFAFIGFNIFSTKKFLLSLNCLFYIVLYILVGSLFFSAFHSDAFIFFINGNGGFVGRYLQETFLLTLINYNTQISYYLLMLVFLIIFLMSIQFKIVFFL